ncbi:MAG: radical SAM protein [Candidatus Omnitrophota bacterium]|nr:MAG: radical SAM protein [Candidatus Omnitrophota bacterium]
MNILLVNLPSLSFSLLDESLRNKEVLESPVILQMPLSLLYLSSYARRYAKRDFNLKLLDINKEVFEIFKERKMSLEPRTNEGIRERFNSIVSQAVSDFRPSIVGINILYATSQNTGIFVSGVFRKLCPEAYIIGGGIQATNTYREILNKGSFDAIVRGEGEIPFTELIDSYRPEKKEYPIRGIVNRIDLKGNSNDTKAEMVEELDEIPFPAWDLLEGLDDYITQPVRIKALLDNSIRAMPILTTRGCPKRCSFCASHTVHGRKIRSRSLENIYEEIETMIAKFHINTLFIEDDLFTYDRQRTVDFCREAIKRNWNLRIEFPNGVAIWTLDEVSIDSLIKAGTKVINIAVESGSPYVQKQIIRKNLNLDHVRRVAEIISRYPDIESRSLYVIGFPGERQEHIEQTMKFARSMPCDWSVFHIAMPVPGSDLFEEYLSLGYISRDSNFDDFCKTYLNRNFDTKEFSKEEMEEIQSDLNIKINFLSNRNILRGNYKKALSLFQKIIEDYPFHVIARYCLWNCLRALKMHKEAQEELNSIFYWIKNDEKSQRLYDKYKSLLEIPEDLLNAKDGSNL